MRARSVAVVIAVLGTAGAAAADRVDYRDPPRPDTDFWQEIVDPHADEVAAVLGKINQAMEGANNFTTYDTDPDGSQRARLLADARGMARYLRRLAPANPAVLLALGKAADEAGEADEALGALTAFLALDPADKSDATFRIGRIQLRLRRYPDAIKNLRIAAASAAWNTPAIVYLASALTATGKTDEALDLLRTNGDRATIWGGDPQLTTFALAVAYDRDEQITEAFDVIDRMQTAMQTSYMTSMQAAIDALQLVPAVDIHYFRGLLYESSGYLDEARASWALYAAAGDDARFRARALAHVAAIDRLREREVAARKAGRRTTATVTGAPIAPIRPPPRRPHRTRRSP